MGEPDGEQEGYICPSCMENFQTPDDLMNHHGEKHSSLCPVCFSGFPSGEKLQEHFENDHKPSTTQTKNVQEPVKDVAVEIIYDDTEDKQKVKTLKQTGSKLLQEINLLKLCLKKSDEPDSGLGAPSFNDEDCELFISNDGEIVQFCVKALKSQEIEYTVSKQLQRELEEALKMMEKDHAEIQKSLDKLLREKEQILDGYDKLLCTKDECLKTQKEDAVSKY